MQVGEAQVGEAQTDQQEHVADNLQNFGQPLQLAEECRPNRTVTFQGSNDVLTQSTSRVETPSSDSEYLLGFQKDPLLKEWQRQQQRVENQAARAPIILRDIIKANIRAREQTNMRSNPFSL